MPTRSFRFPADLPTLQQLTLQGYTYPPESGWVTRDIQAQEAQNFIDMLQAARRWWALITLGRWLSPHLRNALQGFIDEEAGQPVGLVATGEGANHTWWIANLAVLPAYRRQGIARRLVEAAVDFARASGGAAITLDVIAENAPAYQLYQQLGFEPYNHSQEWVAPDNRPAPAPLPPGCTLRRLAADD